MKCVISAAIESPDCIGKVKTVDNGFLNSLICYWPAKQHNNNRNSVHWSNRCCCFPWVVMLRCFESTTESQYLHFWGKSNYEQLALLFKIWGLFDFFFMFLNGEFTKGCIYLITNTAILCNSIAILNRFFIYFRI